MSPDIFVISAAAFGALTSLLAFATAAIGAWKSSQAATVAMAGAEVSKGNSTAIQNLEIKVDGRLTALLEQTRLVSEKAQEVARLLGREEMRTETNITAADLAEKTLEATLQATKETPVSVDVVSSVPVEFKEAPKGTKP